MALTKIILRGAGALAVASMASCSSPDGPTGGLCHLNTVLDRQTPIQASAYLFQTVTTEQTGRLDIAVDWVSEDNIISVVLTQSPCDFEQFKANHCNVIVNLFPPPKPLTATTYWLRPGSYDLILANFGSTPDVASSTITVRTTGCEEPSEGGPEL